MPDQGWGAVSDLSLISDLSQKFKHDLWRVKSELKLSQKQHLTPAPDQLQIPEWRFICFLGCEIDTVKCYRIFGYMIGSNTRLDIWPFW